MKSKRKLTDKQIEQMFKERAAGKSVNDLCKKYGITEPTFYYYKKQLSKQFYEAVSKEIVTPHKYSVSFNSSAVGYPIEDSKSELDKLQDAMSSYDNLSTKAKALFDKYYDALNAMD